MAETIYTYDLATDFPDGAVFSDRFVSEIKASSIVPSLLRVDTALGVCSIAFADALSAAEKTMLDGLVAAHVAIKKLIEFQASSQVVSAEAVVVSALTWDVLGGTVASPAFFLSDLSEGVGRIVGEIQTSGEGAELQVVEWDGTSDSVLTSVSFQIGDTGGKWIRFVFETDVILRTGRNSYRLEGRRNGATLAKVRFASMALLRVRTVLGK